MTEEEIEQGSEDWFLARCGKFTGSRFNDLTARHKTTGKKLKSFEKVVWDVVVERLTQQPQESITSYSMQWGKDVEPFARTAYELQSGNFVQQVGFIKHPDYEFAGCSPDGLIDSVGGLELKCPKDSAIHLERFLHGTPEEYKPQVQGSLWITGREWWDFCSYDPRMPEHLRLFTQRWFRDERLIRLIEISVLEAEETAEKLIKKNKF